MLPSGAAAEVGDESAGFGLSTLGWSRSSLRGHSRVDPPSCIWATTSAIVLVPIK